MFGTDANQDCVRRWGSVERLLGRSTIQAKKRLGSTLLLVATVTGEDCELVEFDAVQKGFPSLLVGSLVK